METVLDKSAPVPLPPEMEERRLKEIEQHLKDSSLGMVSLARRDEILGENARYDIPWLLSTIRTLQGKITDAERDREDAWRKQAEYRTEREQAREQRDTKDAELSRLRADADKGSAWKDDLDRVAKAVYPHKEERFTYSVDLMCDEIVRLRAENEGLRKDQNTLNVIQRICGDDFCEDLDMRAEDLTGDAKTAHEKLSKVYCLAHGAVRSNTCYEVHGDWRKMAEEMFAALNAGEAPCE